MNRRKLVRRGGAVGGEGGAGASGNSVTVQNNSLPAQYAR